ncbi:MAG TPA: hypothetical protein VM120_24875 [Bryobacteraceae bacterium]|nr:hypothetical protein [Bryobacteraceae bacterium]
MTVVSKTFANEKLADPLELALRDACQEEHDAFKLQKLPFREVFDAYDRELQEKGFLPGPSATLIQARDLTAGLIALVGVSAIKIGVALSRGRTNIIFLVLMTVIAIVLACKVTSPRITLRSKRFLEDLARLWRGTEGRKASLYPHSGSKDLVFLSAVFGMSILPERAFPDKRLVFKEPAAAGCSSGSGCGSSSSDSGSSGGSSCGGGGCGGCCGGCCGGGGCGS